MLVAMKVEKPPTITCIVSKGEQKSNEREREKDEAQGTPCSRAFSTQKKNKVFY